MAVAQTDKVAEATPGREFAVLKSFTDIGDAYRDMAVRNVATFTDAVTAIAAVKGPAELFRIQQRFAKESLETAVDTGRNVAGLMSTALTAVGTPARWLSPDIQRPIAP